MTNKIKNKIMKQIKDDEIKMKSKWVFIIKKIKQRSGFVLSIFLFIFFLNAFLYYIKSNKLIEIFYHGVGYWHQIFFLLPYDIIFIIIFIIIYLNFIIKKFEFSYLCPFIIIYVLVIIISIFLSIMIFISNFNYNFSNSLEQAEIKIPYISNFYLHRCCHHRSCR